MANTISAEEAYRQLLEEYQNECAKVDILLTHVYSPSGLFAFPNGEMEVCQTGPTYEELARRVAAKE